MDNVRQTQIQDIGILRKKDGKEEELFVFGYSCKIYEDYDKSLYVDQGKHLIPWLGDDTLKIDRYDCRGALNDLGPYLPKLEGFDRRASLSHEEKRIEALCDQERFRALTINEEEEMLYQEEEFKRLQKALNSEKAYSEVGFSYDDDKKPAQDNIEKENDEEEDEPFIPPYQLDVPLGMKIPKSKRHHEIIERTAFFIYDQGAQMEILLKMKQADNPQFNFLSFDNELHPYYRHMSSAIKNQRYKLTSSSQPATRESPKESVQEDTYLHPSLVQNSTICTLPESAPKIPNINYKPSVDCTYSALVNRIKETQSASRESSLVDGIKRKDLTGSENSVINIKSEESKSRSHSPAEEDNFRSISSLPLSALTKSARRRRIRKEKHKAAAASFKIYYSEENLKNQVEEISENNPVIVKSHSADNEESLSMVPLLKPVPAPSPVVQIPPVDTQLIIDKMASYVAKNGHDFENVVRAKGDPRFSFLDKEHLYNPYYNQKVQLYLQLENPELVKTTQKTDIKSTTKNLEPGVKKLNTKCIKSIKSSKAIPICFSIKKPKDQETLEVKSALLYEESEREDDEEVQDSFEKNCGKIEEANDDNPVETDYVERVSPPRAETVPIKKITDMTLEKWAQERLKAKLVTVAKEKLAAKDKDKQLQAERRKRATDFINLLQKDNLVNKAEISDNITSASNGEKDISDIITIPSDSSPSDSDSVVSVPISSEEEQISKNLKRKRENADSDLRKNKQKGNEKDRNKDRKSKHRSRSSSYSRSLSSSHHAVKKYDKEKKSLSRKKKHHYYRNSLSSHHKKIHKSQRKSKRSKYSIDVFDMSDSDGSCISGTELSRRVT